MTMSSAMPAQQSILDLEGVCKSYPGVKAVDSVDLSIGCGEVHALLGENGAGKSTLVKMIYGLVQPDAGKIRWRGVPVKIKNPKEARRCGIGLVMQHFSLVQPLTVFDNIALAVEGKETRGRLRQRALAIAEQYHLKVDLDAKVEDLSMGERQRIEIVRALISKPNLLIMDEPTSVLSPREVDDLFGVLRQLASDGTSILYISHKLHEILQLCEKVTVLRGGKRVADGYTRDETSRSLAEKMLGAGPRAISFPHRVEIGPNRLVVSNLSTRSESGHGLRLSNVSFSVRAGAILGIAGIAGNGQTFLHAALSGELKQERADVIVVDGQPIGHFGPVKRRRIGLRATPEERHDHAAVAEMSLADNTLLTSWDKEDLRFAGLLRYGLIGRRTAEIIRRFDVRTTGVEATAKRLSGGNLQKFVVGREVLQEPSVLVVSQPTWGVDAGAAVTIHQALVDLAAEGSAVVIISQDLDELRSVCTTLAVLCEGKLSEARPTRSYTTEEISRLMGGQGSYSNEVVA